VTTSVHLQHLRGELQKNNRAQSCQAKETAHCIAFGGIGHFSGFRQLPVALRYSNAITLPRSIVIGHVLQCMLMGSCPRGCGLVVCRKWAKSRPSEFSVVGGGGGGSCFCSSDACNITTISKHHCASSFARFLLRGGCCCPCHCPSHPPL